jgi:cysteine desulfurase/selenocysteine lyase
VPARPNIGVAATEVMDTATLTDHYDVARRRLDFPVLGTEVYGRPLVYLDNAATVQKPQVVIDRVRRWYEAENANVHRGVHHLSAVGTEAFEQARRTIQRFVGAEHEREIVFTSGTTAAINLVAYSFGQAFVREGDEIVVSGAEHHANLVPWQLLCERAGASLRVLPVRESGDLAVDELESLLGERTRLVAVGHTSNALGTVNPIRDIISLAHEHGVPVLVDGAQAVPHTAIDVVELDADFFCWSAHKAYGPMGFGVLYGKERWLEAMPPFLAGGDMIADVSFERTTFNELPFKFEAGTPNVAGALGTAVAIEYLEEIGMDAITAHESDVLRYAVERLSESEGVTVVGRPSRRAGAVSFVMDGVHPYDAGTVLDRMGVAVRTGHHCAQPLVRRMGHEATIRASFALYSTREEVDALIAAIAKARSFLA